MKNGISQSLGLDLININVYAEVKLFHSVREIRPFSLFQNLAPGKASTDDNCHFAIVSLFSEFEPRQKLNQSQMSKVYQIISLSSSDKAIFTFSEFGARQCLDR